MEVIKSDRARPELSLATSMRGLPMRIQIETMDSLRDKADSANARYLTPVMRCIWKRQLADDMRTRREFRPAIDKYIDAMREIVGPDFLLPAAEYMNSKYMLFHTEDDWKPQLALAECCEGIARCHVELEQYREAIDWLEEIEMLYVCQRLIGRPNDLPWIDCYLPVEDHILLRMRGYLLISDVFLKLGNTGVSSLFSNRCLGYGGDAIRSSAEMNRLQDIHSMVDRLTWRHPEPTFVDKWEVTQPSLQIRGAWTKINTGSGSSPLSRLGFAGFIWNGKLYVAGGQHWKIIIHKDLWCIDLSDTKTGWRRLPDFPAGYLLHQKMQPWNDKAWLFDGKHVWTFDLIRETWRKVKTTFEGTNWPYFDKLDEYTMQIFEGVMWLFGGNDNQTYLGTNILMSLDLTTLVWTHRGGTSAAVATNEMPMLRRFTSSWIVPSQKRLYIMYGNCCRLDARLHGKPHANEEDYQNEDLWSYYIPDGKWRRERLRGSFPAPRTEMAAAYNPALDRVCTYGGYNASATTVADAHRMFRYAYYGDTFVLEPETLKWKHVITRGFPSYRAQAQMLVDEHTGKTYLYGGYTNSDFVPSKHVHSRTFGDLWQLSIDMPGGCMEDADLVKDAASPAMGPWRRCFTCGSVGHTWKKCGGSCKGAAHFCSTECQKEGWKEHKQVAKCRKV